MEGEGGGEELFDPPHQIISCYSETLKPGFSNF